VAIARRRNDENPRAIPGIRQEHNAFFIGQKEFVWFWQLLIGALRNKPIRPRQLKSG
jgi:hypothetical protein